MSVKLKSIFRTTLLMCLLLVCGNVAAQTTAKGTVTDGTGEPIIGASVVEKGNAKNAAITDLDGNFTLKVAMGKTLVISYIGMETQEVKAAEQMNIIMRDDSKAIEEVVVIGYGGSKARKDLTGSVGSISGAKLALVPVASAAEALQGKIAGVQVTTVDGAPGADINIRIRGGGTSLTGNNNQPLFIVDGFQQSNINDIPPTDIQSIDVLKDASLTAIYGSKGANGVVIVTTKSAKAGKVKVEFNAYAKASSLAGKLDVLNTYEFVRYQQDYSFANNTKIYRFRKDYGNPQDMDIYRHAVTHDWQDEIMGNTPISQMYNVSVSGGNETLRFNTSLTHSEDPGIISNSGVRRTNWNTKLNVKLSPRVTLLINPRLTYRRDLGSGAAGLGSEGLIGILRYRPTNGLREVMVRDDKTVSYGDERYWKLETPEDLINQNYQVKHGYTFNNQASLTWDIIDNLTFKTDVGLSLGFSDTNRFYGTLTNQAISNNDMPLATITNAKTMRYVWTNTLNYNLTLKDVHNMSFLIGHEVQHYETKSDVQGARYFPVDITPTMAFNNMGLGTAYTTTTVKSTPDRVLSFFGQANYNYKHKYLASLTFRADGSTKFAPGKQWGYFPSVSGAWVLSEEPFMKDVKWVDQLKLRAAIGMSGDNNIGDDMWRYLYSVNSNGGPSFGESVKDGDSYYSNASGKTFTNKDIKWQTTITRNVAADITLFNGRLTISPEFYWNTTKDLLYTTLIPTTTGYENQTQNIGQVTTKGIELTLNGDILRGKDYVLSANFTMGLSKTKVDKLNGLDRELTTTSSRWSSNSDDFALRVGEEVGLIYGYVYDGIYQFDEFEHSDAWHYEPKEGTVNMDKFYGTQPGRIKFKDISGPNGVPDGIIDEYDRTQIGNTNPRFQGGFGISGQWKNFDFNANFTYMLNYDILNATAYDLSSSYGANQDNPKNISGKFTYANRWVYFGDIYHTNEDGSRYLYNMGEQLASNSQHAEYMAIYEELNAGKTLWNPTDVTARYTHSYFIEDGSFLRLNDITVGYTLPHSITKKWGIDRLRFYVTASNLFCLTNYSGFDPEVDIQSGVTPSVDYNRYPRSHGYLFGVNVSF